MATPTWTTSDGDRFFFRGSARQVREAAYVLAGPEQVKRDLWKAVTDGNVDKLRQYQGLPTVTHAAIGVNSRTGWTIVHEAVERGHSGTLLTMVVQKMGPDSVNKKTRTGLTPAHVAASKRDTVALMALANLGADLSVLAADRVQLRELQKQASEEPPEPLEQARLMLATLDPSALTQPNLDTMQIDLATTKQTLETASERVQREVMRREITAVPRAEEQTCAICLDRPPNVTFVPCGHKMTCEQCAAEVGECLTYPVDGICYTALSLRETQTQHSPQSSKTPLFL